MENNPALLPGEPTIQLVPASLLKRFINYLVDFIAFSFPATFLLMLAAHTQPWAYNLVYNLTQKPEAVGFMDQFMIWFVYGLYISVVETLLKGKSIGKYLTQTRAVTIDGLPVKAQTAFSRGLIRMIPFEQFSALLLPSRPWHDRWSGSFVIDEIKSVLPKE